MPGPNPKAPPEATQLPPHLPHPLLSGSTQEA